MKKSTNYASLNEAKMDFSDLYISTDPRKYFQYLGQLDYIIPHLAQPVFDQLIRARREVQSEPVTVLDLGCSYAINGALMKYALDYEALRQRYTAPALQTINSVELKEMDRHFYQAWPLQHPGLRLIGLDISENAVRYAEDCGILDHGLSVDLESRDLTPREAELLSNVDLIVSTGCVGYVTSKTFQRVMKAIQPGRSPWVASFVLRMFPFDDIAATLSEYGLVTEPYEGATFVQRRFASREEMEATIQAVEARGLDSYGREAEGSYHADLFLSRTPAEIRRRPIQKLVSVVAGANKLWNVGTNVLGSFGPAARRRARAARRQRVEQAKAPAQAALS